LKACSLVVRAACVLAASASVARAQSIEPRAYSNAPVGVNFLLAGPYYTRGGLSFDTSLPVTDPQLKTSNAVVGYARALDLWGKSGKFDVIVPYTWLSGSATYQGDPIEREVDGFADPLFRLSMNFYGAPALTLPEFKSYEQDLIVGASLQVSVPVGQYDSTRLVNIGTNRWSFKPEIGASKALGALTLEFKTGVTLFTTNDDFFNGNKRSQDPLYSIGTHAIYNFPLRNLGLRGRDILRRRPQHPQRRPPEQPAAKLARGRHLGLPGGRSQLDQALREQRGVSPDREQLRPHRHRVAVPVGRRVLMPVVALE